MSTLADRLLTLDALWKANSDTPTGDSYADNLAETMLANSETILTDLAASERLAKEHAELRAALDESRKAAAWIRDRVSDDPGLHEALSNLTTNITAALSPQEPPRDRA